MDGQSLSKQASRIDYIDLFRAIGIILMVMGHVGFGGIFDKWIHVFHMPMFFVISGYFWKDQSFASMAKKKARTLLLPYFAFGLFHLIIHFINIRNIDFHGFYLLFWENTAGVPISGALWFLTAMFFSEVLFWCVQRLNGYPSLIVTALISAVGMVCATYLPFRLPYALDVGMVGIGFYQVGKRLRDKWSGLLEMKLFLSLAGFIGFSVLGLVNGYINLRQGLYSAWPLFWINAVGMTISLWNLTRLQYGWLEKKELGKLLTWIKGIGRDSIIYLCLNQLMILIAIHLVWFFQADNGVELLIKKVIILVISLIELYVVQIIIMKTKLKSIVGK